MKRVLLADANESFATTLREDLEQTGDFTVTLVRDGRAVADAVRTLSPDLLVMDLALPHLDGLCVLRRLRREGITPPTVLLSAFVSERVLLEAAELRADYFLPKPFAPEALFERLYTLSTPIHREAVPHSELIAVSMLHELGLSPGHRGYRYALDGAQLLRAEPSLIHAITKAVYPRIARRHGTSAACVERSLRRAIELAHERGEPSVWHRFFSHLPEGEKPTNGLFLATLAEAASGELAAC